ncbi:multicomponent Na+:H+ antiporter subunit D [Anaerosolibacter carboniphilus]|uniref:Multicomponent Na+:H+ antiporter subunit D n=1 Tax=Anaerosolibacter carboniphilus TaxID=1417629 RepID=A0A841KPB2_9FIRM|nr:proton-conducting transporter membrane subunit [Anaerosolibacter carboniphilus]MBB6213948.1 multicomponent Na+:H+ antiporter subunit D [Anaerosolibacter carboniphilus]
MNHLILLFPVFLPCIYAVLYGLVRFKQDKHREIFIGTAIIGNFLLLILTLQNDPLPALHLLRLDRFVDVYFHIDKMGILFSLLASTLWIFTMFFSMEYMHHEQNTKRFFSFFILNLGIIIGIAFSGNLFTMYIFYELLTLATYPLVIHAETEDALYSGKKYLIYSFFGATLILLGMILLYSMTNDLNFVANGIIGKADAHNETMLMVAYFVMFIGFGVKAALVPFHSWLPSAMVAPTPVSALLHAVAVVKSGIFAIIRVSYFIFGADVLRGMKGHLWINGMVILTIALGSLMALHQDNLKKRLAYSTISQLGYVLLGIVLLNKNALIGGLFHLINHAVVKITLFFIVGAIYFTTEKKYIHEIKGIGREMPITMLCFSIASISLIGIPPTNGFASKWFLALGGIAENKLFFVIILLFSAFLTAGYLLPIVVTAFFQGEEKTAVEKKEPPLKILVPIVVLTGVTVFLGLFPNHVLQFIKSIAGEII